MENKTIAQQLNITKFPFIIKDDNENVIYREESNGNWYKKEYDENCNIIYYETSTGYWFKKRYNQKGNPIYEENSNGFWWKTEYDEEGNIIYFETSKVVLINRRPKVELNLGEITQKFNILVAETKIKK
jgi:hypothetical protein